MKLKILCLHFMLISGRFISTIFLNLVNIYRIDFAVRLSLSTHV